MLWKPSGKERPTDKKHRGFLFTTSAFPSLLPWEDQIRSLFSNVLSTATVRNICNITTQINTYMHTPTHICNEFS